MALKFYLDGFEIEEPENFVGATFTKESHQKYYGLWGGIGLNAGASGGKVKFNESKAVKYIKKQVARKGTKTAILFKVIDSCAISSCNSIEYLIDISDYSEIDCCEVDVSFKVKAGEKVRNKMETKVEIEVTTPMLIQRIGGDINRYMGIYLKEAIEQILIKLGGDITLKSEWLDTYNHIWLTNGYQFGQILNKPLILSLDDVFNGINPAENIKYSLSGNNLIVEKKKVDKRRFFQIKGDFESVTKTVNSSWLFNNVSIGYKEWQGDPNLSVAEYNTIHNYNTGYDQSTNKLDLVSEILTSHYVIEKAITTSTEGLNDKIFMIWEGEALNTNFNNHFTPARMLLRHQNYLALSGDIKFTSGEGKTDYTHTDIDVQDGTITVSENQDFVNYTGEKVIGLFNYEFTYKATIEDFCRIKENILFDYCGKTLIGEVKKATLTINENDSEIAILCNVIE